MTHKTEASHRRWQGDLNSYGPLAEVARFHTALSTDSYCMREFRVGREAKFPFMDEKTLLQWVANQIVSLPPCETFKGSKGSERLKYYVKTETSDTACTR
jgi:hypothetical protein